MNTAEVSMGACRHCGLVTALGSEFCCDGCASVYALLMSRGLGHFYELQREHSFRPAKPLKDIVKQASAKNPQLVGPSRRFYLEGIHCLGCLWLLEKLPEIVPGVLKVLVDMNQGILELNIDEERVTWQEVSSWIARLGYRASAIEEESALMDLRRRDYISQLSRLGVAAFCTGNIMLLAVSIYAGADPYWSKNFSLLSFFLAIPVLTYSAWPLYQSAWQPIRQKRISIDLAIVLAIFSGIAISVWNLLQGGTNAVYFDSLSMLVFLLLASRLLLKRMRESLADKSPALTFHNQEMFLRVGGASELVPANAISSGDLIRLEEGSVVPVDGVFCSKNDAHFDLSLLTGESQPVKYRLGDQVEAGSRLIDGPALLRATAVASESRLAKILHQIRAYELHKSPAVNFADRMGRRFVVMVLALCAAVLVWMPNLEGVQRALALAIVTCPCVLAFAIPLSLTRALQRAAKLGILFRDSSKLELLAETANVFFDKTGTLTNGNFRVLVWQSIAGSLYEAKAAAVALESKSSHPIAKAILRDTEPNNTILKVEELCETPGEGIKGIIDGKLWEIRRSSQAGALDETWVDVICSGEPRARIQLGDSIREESPSVVHWLRRAGMNVHLLSGDSLLNVGGVAEKLDINDWHGLMKPEGKAQLLKSYKNTLMIGDGANDAVAFRASDVSVAMQGAVDLSLRHSDILLTKPGLSTLPRALCLARNTMKLIRTNFSFTLGYNLVAGSLAVTGHMTPLLAAVLMPLSALTVFAFTTWYVNREEFA